MSSAIHQLQRTQTGASSPALQKAHGTTELWQVSESGHAAPEHGHTAAMGGHERGHEGQMLLQTQLKGDGVLSWFRGGAGGGLPRMDEERNALQLAKDAVYAVRIRRLPLGV